MKETKCILKYDPEEGNLWIFDESTQDYIH